MSWNERWTSLSGFIANWSKDKSTKVGAVIVDDRNNLIALGWNGFPRGINDEIEERHTRPTKYDFTEHAERNAIYNAAANGVKLLGCTLYLTWFPCADCARGIIQSGIKTVVCYEPSIDSKWNDSFKNSKQLLTEAGIKLVYMNPDAGT